MPVREFFSESSATDPYPCVQTPGEHRRGIEKLRLRGDAVQAGRLESWFDLRLQSHPRPGPESFFCLKNVKRCRPVIFL
jgi:hypothetical protein